MDGWAGMGVLMGSLFWVGKAARVLDRFQTTKMKETAMMASKISNAGPFISIPK
jgi:pyridoxine/pyridoxamine 5'-phosphate oxidase